MANDKRFIVKNGLRADNVEFTDSQDGSNQITLNMLNTDTLNFEGDAGSLFSISDDLTGTVFSVGDISGIPIIEANGDTHNVTFNEFDGKVMIGGTDSGSTDSDVLNVTGNVRATAYYGDGSNLSGISASGGTDSATVSAIITADVDNAFVDALNVNAATVTATANNTTNETVYLTFVDGATGEQGIETDTSLFYNPSTNIISIGNDTDNYGIIGRARMGYIGFSDYAGFAHIDNATTTNYALLHQNNGSTYLNASSSGTIAFRNNNVNVAVMTANTLEMQDNKDLALGTSSDLSLVHDGSNSYINQTGTGNLYIRQNSTNNISLTDNATYLYYAGNNRLETTNAGITVTGTVSATTFSGSGSDLSSLPAAELTGTVSDDRLPSSISSDITGNAFTATILATARNIGGVSFNGGSNINLPGVNITGNQDTSGNAATATALATGRNIDVTGVTATAASFDGTGDIDIEVTAVPSSLLTGTIDSARLPVIASANDAGTLDGINSTSFLRSDAADTKTSGNLTFNDNVKAIFGTGSDAEIYHNGGDFVIDTNTGRIVYQGQGHLFRDQTGTEKHMEIFDNGSVDLYYDNSKKFETTSTGVTITGTASATTFSGSGASLTNLPAGQLTGTIDSARLPDGTFGGGGGGGLDSADVLTVSGLTSGFREYQGGTTFDPAGGGTGTDTATDVAIALTAGNRIVGTYNGYIRTLVDFSGNTEPLNIGQASTSIINHTRIYGGSNGVELYENTTKRIETTTTGATVTGELVADSATITGSITAGGLTLPQTTNALQFGTSSGSGSDNVMDLNNCNIIGVNRINFADPGNAEGLIWSNIQVFESPDDLSNAAGNFQVVYSGTRRFTVNSTGAEVVGTFTATTKSFDIEHPTEEGKRLRYGSLEGPENGVYVRGRLKGDNRIQLPDYWTGLVDEDTITVNLTPIGSQQSLFVEDIADNQILIGGCRKHVDAWDINCFYTVYGERKDVDQLVVEYDA